MSIISLLCQRPAKVFCFNRLQLNPTKTEFIWFGTCTTLSKIAAAYRSLPVRSSVIQSCETVRDLRVWFDSELSMKTHINKVVSICYYHLRRLRQRQQHCRSQSTPTMPITSLILQRLDYCNIFGWTPGIIHQTGCKMLQPV